ncbi:HAD family hydrolase [Cohnella hashimotonis]|uniref:HAD family hydrolase n=1 Tax=Cohnella hashimotonis TaxID=2826895 RepID=A0ABT6TBS8_9BACL|nr:HAD family hydrolase [Cohnella hashimotonis]MDI4644301.1 HAD family hydrolase [Cohnella hashimotonis]
MSEISGRGQRRRLILFLDSGDTIVDESTEIRDADGIVVSAELIPGADAMVKTLHERGFTLALVADGDAQSFKNVYRQHGLYDYFEAMIYSENIKAVKPSARMFKAALGALELGEEDCSRVAMVGNNLSRDVKGANALGIASVHIGWTPRYPRDPADESERPDYTIGEPIALVQLAEKLDARLAAGLGARPDAFPARAASILSVHSPAHDGSPTDGNPADGNPADGNISDGNPADGSPADGSSADLPWQTLASRYAPILLLDAREPFRPIRAGITVFRKDGPSPSFNRQILLDPGRHACVIEYAIYWDYDIQHLYDLEHVWIYVGHQGEVVSCEASFHGRRLLGLNRSRDNLVDSRVRLYVQPGKHAMSPIEDALHLLPDLTSCCMENAGTGGLLEPAMFAGEFRAGAPADVDVLAERHLRDFGFIPSFDYAPWSWPADAFVRWEALREEIPVRMRSLIAQIAE